MSACANATAPSSPLTSPGGTGVRIVDLAPVPPGDVSGEEGAVAFAALAAPPLDRIFAELEEDALPVHLGSGKIRRRSTRERHAPLLPGLVEGRLDSGEAEQRLHLAQPIDEHDALE